MAQAKYGDTVNVNYTGKLNDGTVFDSSEDKGPLQFTIGEGRIIPGFEQAVVGMEPGQEKTVEIPSNEAYGPHRDELVAEVDKSEFPADMEPNVGDMLQVSRPDGQAMVVTVSDVSDNKVKLDANHPLAGKDLKFDIKLESIA